ncbi:MAG: hypothetical protein M1839_009567 [Geoglossum umbratile]|nr:MAG: hypothetical protein M1839_009567 [Geoglossum umbratile]
MSITGLSVLEAIYSCGICFTSYSDIYKDDDPLVDTLSDPGLSLRGTVPKLWMTSCGHVICSRHLEGGDMMTKCTICDREFGKKNDVILYPVWGVTNGFYDARLPKAFFQVPPIKFDKIYIKSPEQGREPSRQEREANEHAREALRFQFISLTYYAKGVRGKLLETENQLRKCENELEAFKVENTELLRSLHRLECQREECSGKLAVLEEEKSAWQRKKRMAIHYVSLVGALADENAVLKKRLVSLGYPVEDTHYTFNESEIQLLSIDHTGSGVAVGPNASGGDTIVHGGKSEERAELVSRGTDNVHVSHVNGHALPFSDPKKRKYLSSRGDVPSKARSVEDLRTIRRQLSRDNMPPPPLPYSGSRKQTALQIRHSSPPGLPSTSVPVITASQASVRPDVAVSRRLTDWPFTGPDQIDATRGQTATSAYFPKRNASYVYPLGSVQRGKNGSERSSVLPQRNIVHTADGSMNRTRASLQPVADPQAGSQIGTITHGWPSTQTTALSQNRHRSLQPLTAESLATLKDQLIGTVHRNRQYIPVSKNTPLLNRRRSSLIKDRSIPTSSPTNGAALQGPVRNSHTRQNGMEIVCDRPLLGRGSSYNGESSCISDATAYERLNLGRGPSYSITHQASSISRSVAIANNNTISPIHVPPGSSSRCPLTSQSTTPIGFRGSLNTGGSASNPAAQRSFIQTGVNTQSPMPGWYSVQARPQSNLGDTPTLQGQACLSIGSARGLVSRSGRWILKKGTQRIRSLTSRGPSVSSPFFKRNNTGPRRCPSPTMEESESYEVYQRYLPKDYLRIDTSQLGISAGRSRTDREASVSRSAAIREHIVGPSTPEDLAGATPPYRRPFIPHYISPSRD